MLSEANQTKLDNFQDNANAHLIHHLPTYIEQLLTQIYVYGKENLSKNTQEFEMQKQLIKVGLLTIQDKKNLVLTKQGKDFCQVNLAPKHISKALLLISTIFNDLFKIFIVLCMLVFLANLGLHQEALGSCLLIFFALFLFNYALYGVTYAADFLCINRVSLKALKWNLKQYCTNDYQKEFSDFVNNLLAI